MLKIIGVLIFFSFVSACTFEHEGPDSQVYVNTLPKGGLSVELSEDGQLANVLAIESSLSKEHQEIFNASIQWIATESDIPFSSLEGKTAFDLVQVANCLKKTGNNSTDCI